MENLNIVENTNEVIEDVVTDVAVVEVQQPKVGMSLGKKVAIGVGVALGVKFVVVPAYKKVKAFIQKKKQQKADAEANVTEGTAETVNAEVVE